MAMSRKNYEQIAAAIKAELASDFDDDVTPREAETADRAVARVAQRLANEFKDDNPRFRFDTFFAAIGLDEWGNFK